RWGTDRISAKGTISNVIRNATLQLVIPNDRITRSEERTVRYLIKALGADPDDPAVVWPNVRFQVNGMSRNEGTAGNPLHFLLIVLACVLCLMSGRRPLLLYALGLIGAFVLFSALLRWQMWGSRHELPLLALGCPLVGIMLERH